MSTACQETTPETQAVKPSMRLAIFAYHVACLMENDAPAEFSLCPISERSKLFEVKVKIEPAREGWGKVWDSCYLNGKSVGNRFGAMEEFVRLVSEAAPVVEFD